MKVVIFCGGLGVRMGEETQRIPKPMIHIGSRPILWEIMRYYAAWGHNEFVLCLGYKGDAIREYFLNYNEALFSDFVLEGHGADARVELLDRQVQDWRVTFAATGMQATIGGRLKAVERYLADDEEFLATYGDGLTDAPLDAMIESFRASGKLIQFLSVRTQFNAHRVLTDDQGVVTSVVDLSTSDVRINGGFFVCKRELLDEIQPGDELVEETFARLIPAARGRRVPVRGILRADGHDQGPPAARVAARFGQRAVADGRPARGARGAFLMLSLGLSGVAGPLDACSSIGCHADDVEIGCGATLLGLVRERPELEVTWVVLAGAGDRGVEARASAEGFLAGAAKAEVVLHEFRDGFMPYRGEAVKEVFEELKRVEPDLVLTHTRADLHQDHRLACELTWNTFRDHLVLEYEIPKVDGDLGTPEPLHSGERGPRQGENRSRPASLPDPARQALVRCRHVSGPHATAGDGMPLAERVRRGILCAESCVGRTADAMNAVLVTGHHGYIGSVLTPLVADAGHDVTGLDTLSLPRVRPRPDRSTGRLRSSATSAT